MSKNWCVVCCTRHRFKKDCPGELLATGPESSGWRVNIQTPSGIEACGVLIAEADGLWRARILTYPNVLWTVPGGGGTMKFVAGSAGEAERQAMTFLRRHVQNRGYTLRDEVALHGPEAFDPEPLPEGLSPPPGSPAERKIRFLSIRFGVAQVTEIAGTGNLSSSGLFIITNSPEGDGTWLNMMLDVEGDPLGLRGLVRWKNRQHRAGRSPGMGVQLEAPPPSYLDYIRTLS